MNEFENYTWIDTPFADIELHIRDIDVDAYLLINSFHPERTREYIQSNRSKHDQKSFKIPIRRIGEQTYRNARWNITVKMKDEFPTEIYIFGVGKLTDWRPWRATWKKPNSFVASTYLNQCGMYGGNGHAEEVNPYEEIAAAEPFSTMGMLAQFLADLPPDYM